MSDPTGSPGGGPTWALRRVQISSLATFVPARVLTNSDLETMVDTSDEWILKRTGVRERHIADTDVATSDLAAAAARAAIGQARLVPSDIEFLVVGTTTPDMFFPSTACLVQDKIGAVGAWGFDLGAACSGFTYALTVAAQLVATGAHAHALAIGADVMSRIIDYEDRTTCVIFGDGAGAVVVSPAVDPELSVIDFCHEVDGSGGPALRMPAGGSRCPRLTRRSTSGCTMCIRMARPSSSSPCARPPRSAVAFSRGTGCRRTTWISSCRTRRTGGSSRLPPTSLAFLMRRSSSTSTGTATPPARLFRWRWPTRVPPDG